MKLLFLDKYEIFIKKFDHFNKPYSANAFVEYRYVIFTPFGHCISKGVKWYIFFTNGMTLF